jgi:hypothetical protein
VENVTPICLGEFVNFSWNNRLHIMRKNVSKPITYREFKPQP